jgi:hypothetical protein
MRAELLFAVEAHCWSEQGGVRRGKIGVVGIGNIDHWAWYRLTS